MTKMEVLSIRKDGIEGYLLCRYNCLLQYYLQSLFMPMYYSIMERTIDRSQMGNKKGTQ